MKSEELGVAQNNEESGTKVDQEVMLSITSTPKKNKNLEVAQSPTLRRSPRKLSSQSNTTLVDAVPVAPAQQGPARETWKLPRRSPRKHPSTFEVLKPPQSLCPGVRPVNETSFISSKVATSGTNPMIGHPGGRNPAGYSKLTISGSAIVPSASTAGSTGMAMASHWDDFSPQPNQYMNHQVKIQSENRWLLFR